MTPPLVCLVIADAEQARLYSLSDTAGATLHDRGRLLNTSGNGRPCDQPELDQRFAADIVAAVTQLIGATECRSLLVVANGYMLVVLRALLSALTARGISLVTVPRDLVHETPIHVHEHLARLGLVPGRSP